MQVVLSEMTVREIDQMTREELLEAYDGFAEVCRHQPAPEELDATSDEELRQLVCAARRRYCVSGY